MPETPGHSARVVGLIPAYTLWNLSESLPKSKVSTEVGSNAE